MPNFSLLFHAGADYPTGFIQGYTTSFNGGAWMGASLSNRVDGFFGVDYYDIVNVIYPGFPLPVTLLNGTTVLPTNDVSISINTRWYLYDKWDNVQKRFNVVPYLVTGLAMDLLVDVYPRDVIGGPYYQQPFYNLPVDILFGANLGVGLDFPIDHGKDVIFYGEGIDHFIFWDGLSQIFIGQAGIKFMLDTAHVDPFRN